MSSIREGQERAARVNDGKSDLHIHAAMTDPFQACATILRPSSVRYVTGADTGERHAYYTEKAL